MEGIRHHGGGMSNQSNPSLRRNIPVFFVFLLPCFLRCRKDDQLQSTLLCCFLRLLPIGRIFTDKVAQQIIPLHLRLIGKAPPSLRSDQKDRIRQNRCLTACKGFENLSTRFLPYADGVEGRNQCLHHASLTPLWCISNPEGWGIRQLGLACIGKGKEVHRIQPSGRPNLITACQQHITCLRGCTKLCFPMAGSRNRQALLPESRQCRRLSPCLPPFCLDKPLTKTIQQQLS